MFENIVLPPKQLESETVDEFEKRVRRHLELRITNIKDMHEAIGWIATHQYVSNLDAEFVGFGEIVPYMLVSFDYLGNRMSIELAYNIFHAESWGFISVYPAVTVGSDDASK